MIADDKTGQDIRKVHPEDELRKVPHKYDEYQIKSLKGRIEDDLYFGKYNVIIDNINDLVRATTVKDLSDIIYNYTLKGN